MSNESQARQVVDSFPIQKATVDDIEIEYRILGKKILVETVMIPHHSFSLQDYG